MAIEASMRILRTYPEDMRTAADGWLRRRVGEGVSVFKMVLSTEKRLEPPGRVARLE